MVKCCTRFAFKSLTVVLMSGLPFSFSCCFCSHIPRSLGVLSCLSTLIILLMYACARLEVLTWRFSSNVPVSIFAFLRPFPLVRLSQTVPPELGLLRPNSEAEFFLFLPTSRPPIPPSLRGFTLRLSREKEGLDLDGGPDSEAERTRSFPFFRLMGKSLNHLAMVVKQLTSRAWSEPELRAAAPTLRTDLSRTKSR